jgi:PKHD-type hydroxylase
VRTDLSATLFISEPSDYDGGELVIEGTYGTQNVKLAAGDMILYPATSLHKVAPVTRGSRWASFFWIQSMVKDEGQRRQLFELDRAIIETRGALGDQHHAVIALTGVYHNLLRRWAET